jgi:hypothetical protein
MKIHQALIFWPEAHLPKLLKAASADFSRIPQTQDVPTHEDQEGSYYGNSMDI